MYIKVDVNDSRPAYLQIVEGVRRAIATGVLKEGDKLPAIRDVAVETRVNRNTVSRAYLELEHQGLVRARQGSGVFVSENGPNLGKRERMRILKRKSEELALEAYHFQIPIEDVIELLRESAKEMGGEDADE